MARGRGKTDSAPGAVQITCRTCDGSGVESLPPAYRTALGALEHGVWKTTSTVLAELGGKVSQTALANRLVYLQRLGLATSQQSEQNFRMKEWRRL